MGEVVLVDRLATNTTGRHVKQGTAEFQSQGFAHGLSEGQDAAGATNMDVTRRRSLLQLQTLTWLPARSAYPPSA